jgi:MFS family permease
MITGRRSDATGRRVAWVRAGYATNAVVRPLISVGMFLAWPLWIVACRIGDRVGKGLRGSASDALVADWTDGDLRARAFATMRTADNIGAALGALIAAAATFWWAGHDPLLVAALAVPALAMLWWCKGLADSPGAAPKQGPPPGYWPRSPALRLPLAILGTAALASKLSQLLVLAYVTGQPIGDKPTIAWPVWQVCLAWAALALTQAAASSLAGSLTARMKPQSFLLAGWIVGAAVFAGFAVAEGPWLIVVGVGYGLLVGFTEGAEKSWLASIAPKDERALSFGALALVSAGAGLAGTSACGVGLRYLGAPTFFLSAGLLALAALVLGIAGRKPPLPST